MFSEKGTGICVNQGHAVLVSLEVPLSQLGCFSLAALIKTNGT